MNDFIERLWNTHLDLGFPPELGQHPSYWKNVEKAGLREVAFSGNLGWLLNPGGNHSQGKKPAQMLLEAAHRSDVVPLLTENAQTELERKLPSIEYVDSRTSGVDRLDILIKDETTKVVIAIEVKVRAKEHFNKDRDSQLKVYREKVKATYESIEGWKHVFIFLTPNGEDPKDKVNDEKLGVTESKWYDEWVCLDFKALWPIFEDSIRRTSVQFDETLDEDFLDTRCLIRDLYTFTRVEFFEYFKRESNETKKVLAKLYDALIGDESSGFTQLQRIDEDPRVFAEAKRLWGKKLAATDSSRAKDTHRSMTEFERIFSYLLVVQKDSMATIPTSNPDLREFEKHLHKSLTGTNFEGELSSDGKNLMSIIYDFERGIIANGFRENMEHKKRLTWQSADKSLTVWDQGRRAKIIVSDPKNRPYLRIQFECTRAQSHKLDAFAMKSDLSKNYDLDFYAPLIPAKGSSYLNFADEILDADSIEQILGALTAFAEELR